MRPRIWPYACALALVAVIWTAYVMTGHYKYWQTTGQEMPHMGSSIRNGVLIALGVAAIVYGASFAWLHRPSGTSAIAAETPARKDAPALVTHGFNGSPALLSQTGQKFVLEVRGVGVVTGWDTNAEITRGIDAKADNHATYFSTNPEDYPDSDGDRATNLNVTTGTAFGLAARHAVERWPVPVIVWEPPKDPKNQFRAATIIADGRTQASLGVTLFLWQEDANTGDGADMIEKLFAFFDAHPDVPAALVYSRDGSTVRSLLKAPGSGGAPAYGHAIPALPDSVGAVLVSRSDRVDKLIRPFAVDQTPEVNKNDTEYDVVKLWNFYWARDRRFQEEVDKANGGFFNAIVPRADWWQTQLPELWKTTLNKGPGQFTPTPYIPVRWTAWQVEQFDKAPLVGYLHRPVDVKLTDEHGQPLKTSAQAEALATGWKQAVAALPDQKEPKRVFYDTTGDKQWAIPLTQALGQAGPSAPSLGDVKEGYDIGARIGNTGVSSPLVQIGLGAISSYQEGGASATINRRPNGTVSIVMVSPPDAAAKAAWAQANSGASPFK
ncbi:DUF2875 domain-containing protein [Paraburkholderia dipogonis]|uniref:DUF2875 domain-containing protein n=1 Tax=Paraburkholderia dipogonis TaxID=1211383 RepID=A0A4Y8N823_9BURK|nr:DUF2875 family protein [Paraburkholderia dipogonis]TFE45792.1 DUF2875 domain-containing protein [Paraburkholderia dipogonis]